MHIHQNKLLQKSFLPDVQARRLFTTGNHRKHSVERLSESAARLLK